MTWIADRRLWLTRDGKVVEDGDPRAFKLLIGEGGSLPEKPKVETRPGEKAVKPAEDKAVKPGEDKAAKEQPAEERPAKGKADK